MGRSEDSTAPALTDIDRVVVWFNPASTHAARSRQRIDELKKLFPKKVRVVRTARGGREASLAKLRREAGHLGPRTLLAVAAGDGTVGLAVEALVFGDGDGKLSKTASRSPILPLWGGNANDLAYMLNGLPGRRQLAGIFEQAQIVPIYPLVCTITDKDGGTVRRVAAAYISFGASAFTAQRFNDRRFRGRQKRRRLRFVHELAEVLQIFASIPHFSIAEKGKRRRMYELLFANGSRIAKVDRLPSRLAERAYYRESLERRQLLAVFSKLLAILRGGQRDNFQRQPTSFTVHHDVWVQFDGEPSQVDAGSRIDIRLAKRPFYAVASALRTPRDE